MREIETCAIKVSYHMLDGCGGIIFRSFTDSARISDENQTKELSKLSKRTNT